MMHGREKSDSSIVARKPTNQPATAGAEPVEPREETKGNAQWQRMRRTQCRERVYQQLERVRQAAWPGVRFAANYPRWEPGA